MHPVPGGGWNRAETSEESIHEPVKAVFWLYAEWRTMQELQSLVAVERDAANARASHRLHGLNLPEHHYLRFVIVSRRYRRNLRSPSHSTRPVASLGGGDPPLPLGCGSRYRSSLASAFRKSRLSPRPAGSISAASFGHSCSVPSCSSFSPSSWDAAPDWGGRNGAVPSRATAVCGPTRSTQVALRGFTPTE